MAGVIGRKKFIYDLWGAAVNVASRMESQGASGIIQITRSTHDLIKDQFDRESGGTIKVKSGDEMEVWRVLGRRADPRPLLNLPPERRSPTLRLGLAPGLDAEPLGALLASSSVVI